MRWVSIYNAAFGWDPNLHFREGAKQGGIAQLEKALALPMRYKSKNIPLSLTIRLQFSSQVIA